MKIKTLEGIDKKDIVNVFNESFSDYVTPLQLTEEQLTSKMTADKTELSLSVGVFDNEKLVAFILHGFDVINNQKVIYNGGTGVVPEKRGQGLTSQMYQFILPSLQERRIDKLQLEVITDNLPAIRSYEKSGFSIERKVRCYKGEVKITSVNDDIRIEELKSYNWDLMEPFWDVNPTWQNSKKVLDALKSDTIALAAYVENELVGYVIFSPDYRRIHQIAVSKDHRNEKVASTLLHKIIQNHGSALSIINVDENSKSMHSFLEKIGCKNHIDQYEMILPLNSYRG